MDAASPNAPTGREWGFARDAKDNRGRIDAGFASTWHEREIQRGARPLVRHHNNVCMYVVCMFTHAYIMRPVMTINDFGLWMASFWIAVIFRGAGRLHWKGANTNRFLGFIRGVLGPPMACQSASHGVEQ